MDKTEKQVPQVEGQMRLKVQRNEKLLCKEKNKIVQQKA